MSSNSEDSHYSDDSPQDEDNKKDYNQLILSNTPLRNLLQLGYNSRLLTKNLVNSIKFREVIRHIIDYASSNELSVRSYGPLLLGLVRIYDKKLKNILEEFTSLTKVKTTTQTAQEKKEDKKKAQRSKRKVEESSNTQLLSSATSNGALLAISPMKEGVFSLMNNYSKDVLMTPSKQAPNYDLISQDSRELLRATKAQVSTLSKKLLSSNKKKSENDIQQPELNLNEHQPELNNFFDFVNEANDSLNMNIDLNYSGGNKELSDRYAFSGSKSKINKVSFREIENALKQKQKQAPYTKRNAKLEYDEDEMEINLEPDHTLNDDNAMKELLSKLKKNLKVTTIKDIDQFTDIKYDYLYPELDKIKEEKAKEEEEDNTYIKKSKKKKSVPLSEEKRKTITANSLLSGKKRVSIDSFDLDSTVLIKNLSRLSLDRKDFSNLMSFNEKLDQIKEDVKEKEEISFDQKDFAGQFDFKELNDDAIIDKDQIDLNINALSSEVQQKILKKQKSIPFNDLHLKLEVQYSNKSELLYDLLSLAQKGEFDLNQETLFDNSSILISKLN